MVTLLTLTRTPGRFWLPLHTNIRAEHRGRQLQLGGVAAGTLQPPLILPAVIAEPTLLVPAGAMTESSDDLSPQGGSPLLGFSYILPDGSHHEISFELTLYGQLTTSLKDLAITMAAEDPVTWTF
jgi:hypothetical protein